MQFRKPIVFRLGIGLAAIFALALVVVAFGMNSDSPSVSAEGPVPTKIANDGNLAGVSDILVGDITENVALFWCISKTDHADGTNEIKNSLQCNIDVPGQGETTDTPPGWCDLANACNPSVGEADLTPGTGGPLYSTLAPSKGFGEYYPDGNNAPAAASCYVIGDKAQVLQPCIYTISCFEDVGPPSGLGPNILTAATVLDPKNPTDDVPHDASAIGGWGAGTVDGVSFGHVDIWYNVNNDRCKSLVIPARNPNFDDAALFSIAISDKLGANPNPNPAPWRVQNASSTLDWDGDGCTDEEELDKNGVGKCGDDPFNPSDSFADANSVDLSGTYGLGVRLVRADCGDDTTQASCVGSEEPGFYFTCLADVQHNTGNNDVVTRAFCLTDSGIGDGLEINKEAYPGAVGDGHAGGLPPGQRGGPGTYSSGFFSWAYGDVDFVLDDDGVLVDGGHAVLTGTFNKGTNEIEITGCFIDFDGFGPTGNVYIETNLSAHQLPSTVDIYSFQSESNCTNGTPTGDAGVAAISITRTNPAKGNDNDNDNDGVPTSRELGDDPECGLRDPGNGNDYYDVSVPRDGVIDLSNDILGVIQHYAPGGYTSGDLDVIDGNPDPTTFDNFDRPPTMANAHGDTWNRGSPDGVIDLSNDILGVIQQYNPAGCPA